MPKKEWTDEERKAFADKMKQARQKKDSVESQQEQVERISQQPDAPANMDLNDFMRQLQELKDNPLIQAIFNQQNNNNQNNGVQVGNKMTGVFTKYITDPAHYPDPRERILDFFDSQPKYRRFGLRDRYELRWEIAAMVPYERKDGIQETQPRFVVGLDAIIFDEDTYEPTNGRYVVKEFMFFEDPQTAVILARDNGIDVDETNEKAFMDEMRFIRVRDWLLDIFTPAPVQKTNKNRKDMVINGKQVQFYEIASENAETIPFNQLNKKL